MRWSRKVEPSSLAYTVLEECLNYEELFVLASLIDTKDAARVEEFLTTIVQLVSAGLLECTRGGRPGNGLSLGELHQWVQIRLAAGEELSEVPEVASPRLPQDALDYAFRTTDDGQEVLKQNEGK